MVSTFYEYDDNGRLTASHSISEPRFTPDDVAVMLESARHDRELGPHGYPMSLATDPATKGRIKVDATVDFIEQAIRNTQDQYRKDYGHQNQNGFVFSAHLKQ